MPEQGINRRHAIGAGAAVAAWAVVSGRQQSGPAPGFSTAEAATAGAAAQAGAAVQNGTRAHVVGATVSPAALGTSSWLDAARRWDRRIGRPMAVTAARMYFQGSTLESGPGIGLVRHLARHNVKAVLSFQPSRRLHPAEITRLRHSIHRCREAGLHIEAVALWHEPNDITKHPHPFRSAREYHRYVHYYGPHVTAMSVPLAYIPLVLTNEGKEVTSYFPGTSVHGKRLVSKIFADYYCHAQYVNGVRLAAVLRLARHHRLPLGLGEFGMTDGPYRPSDAQFHYYMAYLTKIFAAQRNPGSCMYFVNGHRNIPTTSGYTALRRFYDALL